ncbi:MAG: primosomal protein [Proteobacteria bacterium]|jgi:hypothetical protein|nr:primosomal protein [Pseudomonadota bacterium]NBP16176.1 primosomal protein [bacterium]
MKLLVDEFNYGEASPVNAVITEAAEGKEKKYFIEGIWAQAELKNRNGRVYPKNVMEKALGKYQDLITAKRALGEMSHPDHPQVNLERASHLVESLKFDGNNVVGRARILTHLPMGKIAKGLIDEGVPLGVSTRGLGSLVEKNGAKLVQDDFTISAIDIVGDPSAPEAWMTAVMEGAEWVYNASTGSWMIAEQVKHDVKTINAKQVANKQAQWFKKFLESIE